MPAVTTMCKFTLPNLPTLFRKMIFIRRQGRPPHQMQSSPLPYRRALRQIKTLNPKGGS